MATKFVIVTGGIVSGLGKGISSASIGKLLKDRGISVSFLKMDPYLNRDAGTMNPFQHGEVFVTDDGAETDLDLGHYERFMDLNLSQLANVTSGVMYENVMAQERRGDYLGKTIQIVPHVTDEIKRRIREVGEKEKRDVVIVEVGGTIGDLEGLFFNEAIRQLKNEVGRDNMVHVHVVKVDYIYPSDEEKTKPIQFSVQRCREMGIPPDILIVRCKKEFNAESTAKIALFTEVTPERIIPAPNADLIYEIPLSFEKAGLGLEILKALKLPRGKRLPNGWDAMIARAKITRNKVRIGVVGKYLENPDAYLSVMESLRHGAIANHAKLEIVPIYSDTEDAPEMEKLLRNVDGILVPGGFGIRGIEGKIRAIEYARTKKIPFLGLCLGLQVATIEFARHVCRLKGANSTEFDAHTEHPVIDILPEQRAVTKKGGTMRLGAYPAHLRHGSLTERAYVNAEWPWPYETVPGVSGTSEQVHVISERHRHRYEVNPDHHEILQKHGLIFSGNSPDGRLVEIIELARHPFFVGTQFHPEFKSRPERAQPLFREFIKAALR